MNIDIVLVLSIAIFCEFFVPNFAKYSDEDQSEIVKKELQGIVFINKYSSSLKSYTTICSANVVEDNQSILISPDCRSKFENLKDIFVTLTSSKLDRRHRVHGEMTYNMVGDEVYNNFTILKLRSPLENVQPMRLPEPGMQYNGKLKTYREILDRDTTETWIPEAFLTEIINAEKCMEIFAKAGISLQLDGENAICTFAPNSISRLGDILGGAYCDDATNLETSILCFTHYPNYDKDINLPEIYHSLLPIASWIKSRQNYTITDYLTFKNILVFYGTVLIAVITLMCIGYSFWKRTGYRQLVMQFSTYP